MIFLRVFAGIVVEVWRQIESCGFLADAAPILRGTLTRRWLMAFEHVADIVIDRLTLHGIVDAWNERNGRAS